MSEALNALSLQAVISDYEAFAGRPLTDEEREGLIHSLCSAAVSEEDAPRKYSRSGRGAPGSGLEAPRA